MKRLMVISPHCDDAEIGAGGYIAKTVDEGGEVLVVVATVAQIHFLHLDRVVEEEERINEFQHACLTLGAQHARVLVHSYESNLNVYPMGDMVRRLDDLMLEFKPTEVLIPLPSAHQDHVYMHQASVAACRPTPKKNHVQLIAAYEYPSSGWGPGSAVDQSQGGMYVDITKYMKKKENALNCYKTQMRGKDSLISTYGCEALAKLRGIEAGFEYAELFHIMRWRVQ